VSHIKTILWGLAQALVTLFICALGTLAYIRLQGWENPWDGFMDRIALLLVFVVLALVTGSVILARPVYLILQRRINEGYLLLFSTIMWLVLILACVLAFMVSFDVHTI
jgi:hypothetical protein